MTNVKDLQEKQEEMKYWRFNPLTVGKLTSSDPIMFLTLTNIF